MQRTSNGVIKVRTIMIFCILWVLMVWFIVSYNIEIIIKLYPLMTSVSLISLAFIYWRGLKNYLKRSHVLLYKELFRDYPLVNGFAFFGFVFSASDCQDLKKVKITGRIIYIVCFLLFISMPIVAM